MLNFRVKNKIIISSLALAFFVSPATFAVSYYAGISGGNQYLMNDSSVDILPGSYYPDGSFVTDEIKTGDSGGVGEFYFGISSMPYKSMYIGLEANITGFSASSNSEVGYQADDNPVLLISSDSSVKYAAGLSIMPGYVFSDSQTMVYARMGIEYIRFSNTLAPSNNEYDPGTSFVDPADGFTADSIAYRAGLGIEHYVSPSLSLRVEGDFWHVNKIDNSILYVSIANDPAYNVERVSTFGINMITATVGLTYHFGG